MEHICLQVLDRGEKIELLVDKTENLRSQVTSLMQQNIYALSFSLFCLGLTKFLIVT